MQVTDVSINIFNRENNLHASYSDPKIKSVVFSDDYFMYCLAGDIRDPIKKSAAKDKTGVVCKEMTETSGFYIYDISRLVTSDKLELYKLQSAVVGVNTDLSVSQFNERLSFIKDYNSIGILPFCHRNTVNFLGMGSREDYRIWRETDTFFTALRKDGTINMWSIPTGQLVYRCEEKEKFKLSDSKGNHDDLASYQVYRATGPRTRVKKNVGDQNDADDEWKDVSHLMDFYNDGGNNCSYSLIWLPTEEQERMNKQG